MRDIPHHLSAGVPVKYAINIDDGLEHDNFYLFRMDFVSTVPGAKIAHKPQYHLFTTKELIGATERYYHDMETVIGKRHKSVIGYAYPITYENCNNVITTRFFCRFKGDQVSGLSGGVYCALFTAREIRRSKERVEMYIENHHWWLPTSLTRLVRKWFR